MDTEQVGVTSQQPSDVWQPLANVNTVFRKMQFFPYLTSLLNNGNHYHVKIFVTSMAYPGNVILEKLFEALNRHTTYIGVGPQNYGKQYTLIQRIKAIQRRWPRLNIKIVEGECRKVYLLSWPDYNGAILRQYCHRGWVSTFGLRNAHSADTTVELTSEQLNNLRRQL